MVIYTIGHGNIALEDFLLLLGQHLIEVVVDVRSQPYSHYVPQFGREQLQQSLAQTGINYIYMGDTLGGRPRDGGFYRPDGQVNYNKLAGADFFLEAIDQVFQISEQRCTVIMCSESHYKECHRHFLIARVCVQKGFMVQHILPSGELVTVTPEQFAPTRYQLSLFR